MGTSLSNCNSGPETINMCTVETVDSLSQPVIALTGDYVKDHKGGMLLPAYCT